MKENTIKAAVLSALLLVAVPAWAVNKCSVGGKTVYQDAPCAGSGITVAEDLEKKKAAAAQAKAAATPPSAAPPPEIQSRLEEISKETDAKLAKARAACKREIAEHPSIGMTEADFKKCTFLGLFYEPETINETETAAGVSRQYVYRKGAPGVRYLYVRNGRVTAIQR